MRKSVLTCVLMLCWAASDARSQSVSIAKWPGNADGAYSIMLDDYPGRGTLGLREERVDTILGNRDLAVSIAINPGSVSASHWAYARELVAAGHDFVNHTMNHPQGFSESTVALEVDSAQALIERQLPGNECLYLAYPFDVFNDTMVDLLRTRRYIGSRAGILWQDGLNHPGIHDPFKCNFRAYSSNALQEILDGMDRAVSRGGWVFRYFHFIGDETNSEGYVDPYYPVPLADFRILADRLAQLSRTGQLWVATAQRVIKYARARECFQVFVDGDAATGYTIRFVTDGVEINPSPMIDNSVYDEPLTLVLSGLQQPLSYAAHQGGTQLATWTEGDSLLLVARPFGGPVQLTAGTLVSRVPPGWAPAPDTRAGSFRALFVANGRRVTPRVGATHPTAAQLFLSALGPACRLTPRPGGAR